MAKKGQLPNLPPAPGRYPVASQSNNDVRRRDVIFIEGNIQNTSQQYLPDLLRVPSYYGFIRNVEYFDVEDGLTYYDFE